MARIHRTVHKRESLRNGSENHNGVITHPEPGILECEVKWASGSLTMNKASGGDGILAKLFQILKDNAVKVFHSICQQIWKTQQWSQDKKMSVFIPMPKKGNAKECSSESCSVMSDFCDPLDYRVCGISQSRILEWVAVPFSKECSNYCTIALIHTVAK